MGESNDLLLGKTVVSVVAPGLGAVLHLGALGSVDYTPPLGFTGTVQFQYQLTNSRGTSIATVTISVG